MKADFPRYHIEDLPSFLFENKINEKIKIRQQKWCAIWVIAHRFSIFTK